MEEHFFVKTGDLHSAAYMQQNGGALFRENGRPPFCCIYAMVAACLVARRAATTAYMQQMDHDRGKRRPLQALKDGSHDSHLCGAPNWFQHAPSWLEMSPNGFHDGP